MLHNLLSSNFSTFIKKKIIALWKHAIKKIKGKKISHFNDFQITSYSIKAAGFLSVVV